MTNLNHLAPQAIASQLNNATKLGDLAGAYRIIQALDKRLTPEVLLRAGFAVVDEKRPDFYAHAQRQIAQACDRRATGYQLNAEPGS